MFTGFAPEAPKCSKYKTHDGRVGYVTADQNGDEFFVFRSGCRHRLWFALDDNGTIVEGFDHSRRCVLDAIARGDHL